MNNRCDICGCGNIHPRCDITPLVLNWEEYLLWNHPAETLDVPVYFYECDECGCMTADDVCLIINKHIAKQARKEWMNETTD